MWLAAWKIRMVASPSRIARYSPHPEWAGMSLRAIAAAEKRGPIEIAYEIFRGGGAQIVNFSSE